MLTAKPVTHALTAPLARSSILFRSRRGSRRAWRSSLAMRAGVHRFHRDLSASRVWGYEGTVPGPTIDQAPSR
jgi:hypothetical protein